MYMVAVTDENIGEYRFFSHFDGDERNPFKYVIRPEDYAYKFSKLDDAEALAKVIKGQVVMKGVK